MKSFSIFIFLLISYLFSTPFEVYPQDSSFVINWMSDYDESPSNFKLTSDGGFIGIINKKLQTDSSYTNLPFVYKISQFGDTLSWQIEKQDTILTFYNLINLNSNSGDALLMGTGIQEGQSFYYPFTIFIKIDNDLNVIWEKIYHFNFVYNGYRYHALELPDGNILYGCSPEGWRNMFLLKMSEDGDSLQFVNWTEEQSGELWCMTYNSDSTAIWLHTEGAYYETGAQICSIVEIDNNLNYLRHFHYPEYYRSPYYSKRYPGNKLITGGCKIIPQKSVNRFTSYLLDSNLNIQSQLNLTKPDTISRAGELQCIDFIEPSSIFLGGIFNFQGFAGSDVSWMYVTKLNDTLGIEYEKYIGGDANYWLIGVTAAADGGVLLASTRHILDASWWMQTDAVLIKLDANGNLTGIKDNQEISIYDAIIYPNPGKNYFIVRTQLKNCIIQIYNQKGEQIVRENLDGLTTYINLQYIESGYYPYSITQNGKLINSGVWIKIE